MNYCSQCGAPVTRRVPEGDTHSRHVCDVCQTIHYSNPKVVVGCIPEWQGRVLLCRRAIEPRYGLWTLPAGFMENDETTLEGAVRETLEEAHARVRVTDLFALFNLPHVNQVYVLFRAELLDLRFGPGSESLDVVLYEECDVPWESMAFHVIEQALRLYFADRRNGRYHIHTGDILRLPGEERLYETRLLGNPQTG